MIYFTSPPINKSHVHFYTDNVFSSLVLSEKSLDRSTMHEVVIAVAQSNLDILETMLIDRSSPHSASYQKWLTFEEVGDLISNHEANTAIRQWLGNIHGTKVTWTSPRGEYMKVEAPIHVWESVLQTTFHIWTDTSDHQDEISHVYAESYSIPSHLEDHIASIFNTIQIPPVIHTKYHHHIPTGDSPTPPKSSFKDQFMLDSLDVSGNAVTVSFLTSLYKISTNEGNSSQSQSVFETQGQNYSPNDLTVFQNQFNLVKQAALTVNGHNVSICGSTCYEGNLDLQYIMGVSQLTTTVYWYMSGATNAFLAWILDVAAESNPPLVNSISWGSVEQNNARSIMTQFNIEALKLGLQGVTITVSSGDNGVSYQDSDLNCMCDADSSSTQTPWKKTIQKAWNGTGYFPSFPATSQYVTAIGATMGPNKGSNEVTCQSNKGGVITSGGGFSTFFNQSSWQLKATSDYFKLTGTPNPGYNPSGRGYPDISLIGVEYAVIIDGAVNYLYGTSCSSPVFGAFISLINAARLSQGLPSLGFLNPTLYNGGYNSSFTYFNDIIAGENNCCVNGDYPSTASQCCGSGFNATTGKCSKFILRIAHAFICWI